jgi:hypothetical protein
MAAFIPWLLAAAVSLLLVPTWRWVPRRLLLAAGWSATAIVAMIGPAACWALVTGLAGGHDPGSKGIAIWVFGLLSRQLAPLGCRRRCPHPLVSAA